MFIEEYFTFTERWPYMVQSEMATSRISPYPQIYLVHVNSINLNLFRPHQLTSIFLCHPNSIANIHRSYLHTIMEIWLNSTLFPFCINSLFISSSSPARTRESLLWIFEIYFLCVRRNISIEAGFYEENGFSWLWWFPRIILCSCLEKWRWYYSIWRWVIQRLLKEFTKLVIEKCCR